MILRSAESGTQGPEARRSSHIPEASWHTAERDGQRCMGQLGQWCLPSPTASHTRTQMVKHRPAPPRLGRWHGAGRSQAHEPEEGTIYMGPKGEA
ncbi:hypothetical protein NDU88_003711 [Pleurodeles waltl]|uniref:Uncharacterized protein n=1 Tax=Pleurodeles waltl TaxID=8319 RepID=A0AAV7N0W5_PLEWA|nr:hypothetical protein NDU88_003711 [Pleurodeles waltl]